MLINYFKIAIAVLQRRKFFTFLSLFVISFTLTILLVLTSFLEQMFNNDYPDRKRDRSLYINSIAMTGPESLNSSVLSLHFLEQYVLPLKTPERIAFSTMSNSTNTYIHDKKIVVNYKYTDAVYWDILDYDFTEGQAYTAQQVKSGERVAVISESIKRAYFGDVPAVVGKYFQADDLLYRVIGVVKDVAASSYMFYSDLYLPYTVSKTDYRQAKGYFGDFIAILQAPSAGDVPKMEKEFDEMAARLPVIGKEYDKVTVKVQDHLHAYLNMGQQRMSAVTVLFLTVSIFVLLVMLLPAMNLVNINVTRIMERSSEIGVRKAFGATSSTLTGQFIIENLILTLGGGLLSIPMSLGALYLFNSLDLIPHFRLALNIPVLLIGLLTCVVFGFVSGVYPAWRMSKLHVIAALRA